MSAITWAEVESGIPELSDRESAIIARLAEISTRRERLIEAVCADNSEAIFWGVWCDELDALHDETIRIGREFDRSRRDRANALAGL